MEFEYVEAEVLDNAIEDLMEEIASEGDIPQANGFNYNISALHNIGAQ